MRTTRPWALLTAAAGLAGLLVAASVARGTGPAPMSITPSAVAPGHAFVLHFAQPRVTDDRLTFEADGTTHVLQNDEWVEVQATEAAGWSIAGIRPPSASIDVTLPDEAAPGRYQVCVSVYGGTQQSRALSVDDFADLLDDEPQRLCSELEVLVE